MKYASLIGLVLVGLAAALVVQAVTDSPAAAWAAVALILLVGLARVLFLSGFGSRD